MEVRIWYAEEIDTVWSCPPLWIAKDYVSDDLLFYVA